MRVLNSVEVQNLSAGDCGEGGSPASFVAIGKGVISGVYSYFYDTNNSCALALSFTTAKCHFYRVRTSIVHGVLSTASAVIELRR